MEEKKEVAKLNEEIEKQVVVAIHSASIVIVDDEGSRTLAYELAKELSDRKKDIVEWFEPMRKAADDAKKTVLEKKNAALAPIDEAVPLLKKKITDYDQEQERIELARLAQEQKEAAAAAEKERDRLRAEQDEAIENGDDAALDEATRKEMEVTKEGMMPVYAPRPKPKGYVANWQARVMNKAALINAVAQTPSLEDAVIPDEKWLRAFAKSTKGKIAVPGVIFEDIGTVRLT